MQPPAIRVHNLQKRFGDHKVLENLDIDVPANSIFGFLGPNGAGKTTTIRSLLGLVDTDGGEMELLGRRVPDELPSLRGRIGAVVDHASPYPPLSGRDNLRVIADLLGGTIPRSRITELVELVGLHADIDRPAAGYSYGMRQRLALAGALLPEPDLLILDEPANGLDPAGQRELRHVLTEIRDAGATLFISSHLLSEVELISDHVGILDRGRLVAAGPTQELLRPEPTWEVDPGGTPHAVAAQVLRDAGLDVASEEPLVVRVEDPAQITCHLGRAGIWLRGLQAAKGSLEEMFLALTSPFGTRAPEPWEPPR